MESLRELYKIGSGPSSSHTLAVQRAMKLYMDEYPEVTRFEVDLHGSLSLTGKGHYTDHAIKMAVDPIECAVNFKLDWDYDYDSGLLIKGFKDDNELEPWVVYSIGGGSIKVLNRDFDFQKEVYEFKDFSEIKKYVQDNRISLSEFVYLHEPDIKPYLSEILVAMNQAVHRGLNKEGQLLGRLNMPRVAKELYENIVESDSKRQKLIAYAYANMEENATLGQVVTAPTCGASGIMASLMTYYTNDEPFEHDKLIDALAVAGIFGNIIKQNATISGAQGGCQAEVGVGCVMAAAAYATLHDYSLEEIEYACEIAMEHHLGLTCDPVGGYVIIPCIERNAAAVLRAVDAVAMSKMLLKTKPNRVTFDQVVNTMNYTGKKIAIELRETALGGLAQEIIIDEN